MLVTGLAVTGVKFSIVLAAAAAAAASAGCPSHPFENLKEMLSLGNFCTPSKVNRTAGGARTPGSGDRKRDALVKVTFCVHHDVGGFGDTCMHVVGSLPSLGCWDHKKARKMVADSGNMYSLAVYIPEKVEFLYQYILISCGEDGPGTTVWEGAVERKCKVEEACSTPGRRLLLEDDTRGENPSTIVPFLENTTTNSLLKPDISQDSRQQAELDHLLNERSRCQVRFLRCLILIVMHALTD